MQLRYTLDDFNPELWEKLFGAFILVNKSHWRGAPYDAVLNMLKTTGRFEFTVTGMGTWTSKFVLTSTNRLDAALIPNPELSALMQKHLMKMQEQFEEQLKKL